MASIKEYLKETNNLNKRVEIITEFLNNSILELNELITLLESIFDSLRRANNLINFLKNYALSFKTQIAKFSNDLVEVEKKITFYQNYLVEIEQLIRETKEITNNIEENAHSFIKFTRMISYLAENIEVKAYQAKDEGKGLAIIAREAFKIARSSQLLFQHFDDLLDIIRKNVEP
ncbi:MAG: hypothetical protein ABIL18_06500, partial [candidate division WOR-3 bacterium]